MPVTIGGRRESDFTDPIGMLSDCHRRIERFLHTLIELATRRRGGPLSGADQSALVTSLRYFCEAAPKHTEDEEESLFPRLRRIDSPEARSILDRVDGLEGDHERAARSHQEVERLGRAWLAQGQLSPEELARFEGLLAGLLELYHRHIQIEDHEVFPAAKSLLSAADSLALGSEMAARRGLNLAQTISKPNGR